MTDRGDVTVRIVVDRFLASGRCRNPNTRRAYTNVLDRIAERLGTDRRLADVAGDELGITLGALWGGASPGTWNRNRRRGGFVAGLVRSQRLSGAYVAGLGGAPGGAAG